MAAASAVTGAMALLSGANPAIAQTTDTITLTLTAPDALKFDTAAAQTAGSASATLRDGARFLSPRPFQIQASVAYNPPAQAGQITLQNASVFLTLPPGLEFGTNPNTGTTDTATRELGNIAPAADVNTSWYVQATGEVSGSLTFAITLTAQNVSARSATGSILVPVTPLHRVEASAWQMIGFPFQFDPILSNNGDPATVINSITKPADDNAAFFYWIDAERRYERVTRLQTGLAYFYRPNLTRTIFAKGVVPIPDQAPAPAPPEVPTNLFQLSLNPGWNMISNPYVYNIPVSNLRVIARNGNPNLNSLSFTEAVNSGLLMSSIFFLTANGAGYDFLPGLNAALVPWQGYWVFVNTPIVLLFSPPTQADAEILPVSGVGYVPTRKVMLGAIQSRAAFVAQPSMNNWKLQMTARTADGRQDAATLLGVSPAAQNGADGSDLPKPPPPFSDYVYVGIARPEGGRRLAQDMQAPGGVKTWDLEVVSDRDGMVTLAWPNKATLPKRLDLALTDMATGRKVKLGSTSSFPFQASKNTPHRFRVTATTASSTPFAIVNLRSVPTRGGRLKFDFELTGDATLTGAIRTLSGKKTAELAAGRAAISGTNSLYWDGRSADGASLPTGPYLVEITARGADGQAATVKRIVTLLR